MNSLNRRYRRNGNSVIIAHIQNNLREYIIASVIFVLGIMIGIYFVNNLDTEHITQITDYIKNSVNSIKEGNIPNNFEVLKESIKNNILLVTLLWLMGSTVIGLLLVYLIVCFKGFSIGYTISSIVYVLGKGKGTILLATTMLLKSVIAIPCIISLAVSGMRLYKSIMQDRRKENIKIEIARHTLFSVFILFLLICSSFIESYISKSILIHFIKYI